MLTMLAAMLMPLTAPQGAAGTAALAAFDRHCADLSGYAPLVARIEGAGWQRFTPAADSELARVVAFAARPPAAPGWHYESVTLAPGASRDLVAIVTRAGTPGQMQIECRIYQEGAVTPPDAATISAWAKRDAEEVEAGDGMAFWVWRPALRAGDARTGIVHVAANSLFRKTFPGVGLMVMATRAEPAQAGAR